MGERKGTNLYYPPDYDPKVGGLNKFLGTHALRERARKLHMGILIIRFEMPYNIWCDGCGNHIGMGVRYNAEKKKVGMYYSTPVYQFRMKCHLCDNHFEIKTDPGNLDYIIVSGARRQENRWDPKDNEQVVPETKEVSRRLYDDAMYKLEHCMDDTKTARSRDSALDNAIALNDTHWRDDYSSNCALRASFRVRYFARKKELQEKGTLDQQLLKNSSLNIELVSEHEDDIKLARLLMHSSQKGNKKDTRSSLKRLVSVAKSKEKAKKMAVTTLNSGSTKQILRLPLIQEASSSKSDTTVNSSLVNYDLSTSDSDS
ncbi:coiled-coil domain-containing protein 130 homolog isoform X1 [Cephus cinctus]|uniref:Coiled-coil domain-containing protein 130 homolog isoform X1 n=1 Tax=Cephus cinctus TaxID=211228 RepID=A0AAJ7RFQ9_CEPCN|nr:coiled-coil domain-containing protein 130 homolog isoform X1 [Cephus cinctus]XP_024940033.1 coiled-coil domain-containing protein 130 homolog isoform X1 [Cephus cinctus]XP_024940034.1 coiled-coil domain-containing protein 130 homolog isoform X1 [Cephus cinctus]